MADLNYNDMVRAAQDGSRRLQDKLQSLSNMLSSQSNQTQINNEILAEVRQLKNSLNTIQRSMQQAALQDGDQRVLMLVNDSQEIKDRLMRIEAFCQQMSEYMQKRYEAEEEDNQYRGAA